MTEGLSRRRQLQEQLARIAASVPGALVACRLRPDGTYTVLAPGPAFEELFGLSSADVAGDLSAWFANVDPGDLPGALASLAASARDLTPWRRRFVYRHPRKGPRWVDVWVTPSREADGGVLWHGFVMDVTERKAAEARAARMAGLYRALSDASEAIARITDEDELFERICDTTARLGSFLTAAILIADEARTHLVVRAIAGAPNEKALVKGLALPLPPPGAQAETLSIRVFREERALVSDDYRRDMKRTPWLDHPAAQRVASAFGAPLRRGGRVIGVLLLTATEVGGIGAEMRRLLETMAENISFGLDDLSRIKALRASEERYRTLVENLDDVVFSISAEGRVNFVNGAVRHLGYEPEALLGQPMSMLIHPDDSRAAHSRLAARLMGDGTCSEVRLIDAAGKVRIFRTAAHPVIEGGKVVGVAGVSTDLTRQREAEEQLRLAQKMEAVGRLAGGVAHDFNNLLTVINSYSDLAMDAVPEGSERRADLAEIKDAARRATALTRQLLALGGKQVLKPELLDLNALVAGAMKLLRRMIGAGVELVFRPGEALGAIRADPGQIEQVLMNLAVNARDAMPGGGELTIATASVTRVGGGAGHPPGDVEAGDHVVLSVSDTGVGMDRETLARSFEPFFTTKAPGKGTGLGLATVYGIVEQSGGSIRVDSEVGRGTVFEISFPREVAAGVAPAAREVAAAVVHGTESILVVEDEDPVRRLVTRILRAAGYRVIEAAHGAEALAVCEARGSEIDLILTDVVMPGMSGRELLSRVEARWPGMKGLYMSGYTDDVIARRGMLEPGVELIGKPFTQEELTRTVRAVLDAPRRSRP